MILFAGIVAGFMAAVARASGGGLGAENWWSHLPEVIFGLVIGTAAGYLNESCGIGGGGAVWAFFAMELGHGNAYHMGALKTQYPDRWQTLDYIVRPLCNLLRKGWEPRDAFYCWVFMGIKGLLIGLPLFPYGLALAVLWPLAYWIAFVGMKKDSAPAEWISGAFAGLIVAAALLCKRGRRDG